MVRILPSKVRALNPRTVAADLRRRMSIVFHKVRLLTSAAANERFVEREVVSFPRSTLIQSEGLDN